MLHAALAAAATLVSLAFALCTFERWLARERPHELAWSLALAAFALASAALWAGVSVGWDGLTFRLFYLFGALVIVLGAVWSAVRVRRARLVTANVLIAVGTLVTGASGLLNSVLDEMTGFAVALVAGISMIFAGFLVATTTGVRASGARARVPAETGAATSSRSAAEDQELDQGRAQDEQEQNGHGDRHTGPHDGGSRVTASPGPRRSSSAAERRSRARETSP
ncbi:MAG: hypothetical protein M3N28_01970 [Actinomycetota bacterium]|nr:hypothetical protein [Actinomycetota bacterium]